MKNFKRLMCFALALLMLASVIPTSVISARAAPTDAEMMDNSVLDSKYGFTVKCKTKKTDLQKTAFTPKQQSINLALQKNRFTGNRINIKPYLHKTVFT